MGHGKESGVVTLKCVNGTVPLGISHPFCFTHVKSVAYLKALNCKVIICQFVLVANSGGNTNWFSKQFKKNVYV